jgi:hypothetical protein
MGIPRNPVKAQHDHRAKPDHVQPALLKRAQLWGRQNRDFDVVIDASGCYRGFFNTAGQVGDHTVAQPCGADCLLPKRMSWTLAMTRMGPGKF